jgi:hypothetical protein
VALHFMSDKELSRVEILRDLTAGRLTVSAASELMGLERRQVLRLSKAYQEQGATALISKKRGRASNRQMPADIKVQALELIKARNNDKDLHRPLAPQDELDSTFAWRVERTVTNSLTV